MEIQMNKVSIYVAIFSTNLSDNKNGMILCEL